RRPDHRDRGRRRGRNRHARRTAGDVERVRRNRCQPAERGGGGLMAEQKKAAAPERPAVQAPPRRGPAGGGPFGGMGMPVEKSMNFGPSARRLLRRLAPERVGVVFVILLGVLSVVMAVLGPKILGQAT